MRRCWDFHDPLNCPIVVCCFCLLPMALVIWIVRRRSLVLTAAPDWNRCSCCWWRHRHRYRIAGQRWMSSFYQSSVSVRSSGSWRSWSATSAPGARLCWPDSGLQVERARVDRLSNDSFEGIFNWCLLMPKLPSRVGSNERVIMSAALRGRVNGITECGKVFGCKLIMYKLLIWIAWIDMDVNYYLDWCY